MPSRIRIAVLILLIIGLGLGTKFYTGPLSDIIRSSGGGFFYVCFWYLLLLLISPSADPVRTAFLVTAAACSVEFLQLWHLPVLERARGTIAGQLILGTTFAWSDFPSYLIGGIVCCIVGISISRDW